MYRYISFTVKYYCLLELILQVKNRGKIAVFRRH